MTRRPALLGDADVARLLRHVPQPPAPPVDLAERVAAAAIAAGNTGGARARRRRAGRPLWWAIAVIGVAGAVTAAAANGGRFELAKVLEWPQAVIRAAGWAPRHAHGPAVVRLARSAAPPVVRVAAAPPNERAQPTAPLAFAPRPQAPFVAPRVAPRPSVMAPRAPLIMRGPSIAHALVARRGPDAHAIRAARPELRPEVAFKGADRRPERPELAIPAVRPAERSAAADRPIADRPIADVERPKDDAFRFHDADEFARHQEAARRDWRGQPADQRPLAAMQRDQRHPWAGADQGQHRWQKEPAWRQRSDSRPEHPFHPHPPRGRRG
ncbi:MAG TPA: hypothetical protein VN806_11375 [Caulobacteraceae bacterium]|nr:hypothetical protein [Caulobacteraceae bacterium]